MIYPRNVWLLIIYNIGDICWFSVKHPVLLVGYTFSIRMNKWIAMFILLVQLIQVFVSNKQGNRWWHIFHWIWVRPRQQSLTVKITLGVTRGLRLCGLTRRCCLFQQASDTGDESHREGFLVNKWSELAY